MSVTTRIILGGVRQYAKFVTPGGVRYGLVTYYPKTPDHVDPPIDPSPLLMVQRVKPMKGNPWWEKNILIQLRIDEKKSQVAIVKNTPDMCRHLWQIKHLIKVTPVKFPDGLPKDGDLKGTYLHENGTFSVSHKVTVDPKRIEATDNYIKDSRNLDKETIKRELRLKWLNPL